MKNSPCYKCNDREIGCHSSCEKYKEWREQYYDKKAEIKKSKATDKIFTEHIFKAMDNFARENSHGVKSYADKLKKRRTK